MPRAQGKRTMQMNTRAYTPPIRQGVSHSWVTLLPACISREYIRSLKA